LIPILQTLGNVQEPRNSLLSHSPSKTTKH